MNINSCGVSFNGLYKYNGSIDKQTGVPHYNKKVYHVYNSTYHPYENETKEDIEKELAKTNFGRCFTLHEDYRNEGLYYLMNRIKIGAPRKKADKAKHIKEGMTETSRGITLNDSEFYATFNNDQYGTTDVTKLSSERVDEITKNIQDK